ncbi:MAG: hypothetical protein IJA69_01520 [Clostridia bacterium]|nr:hypothetical protein [Clostridia bacterium]
MKNKIIIVGLNSEFNRILAKGLADETQGYYLDIEDYINYSLFDKAQMQQKCGLEYMKKQEKNAIASCVDYENSVLYFPFEYFIFENNYKAFQSSSIMFYIKFSEQTLINKNKTFKDNDKIDLPLICFKENDEQLTQICDYTINVGKKSEKTIIKEIINKIIGV